MKKLVLLISFIFISCGIIHKNKSSSKKDSISSEQNAKTSLKYFDNSKYSLEPIDLNQPMLVTNSKGQIERYYNTKIIHDNTHTVEIKKDTTSKKTELQKSETIKNKETDNRIVWFIIASFAIVFLILILIIIYIWIKSKPL